MPDVRSGLGILRADRANSKAKPHVLRGEVRENARARELLVLTKANSVATVHRGTYLDYIGVKTFGRNGEVTGEHRFLGLWTSTAYYSSPRDIPLLRQKVQRVVDHFALDPASHDAKAVLNQTIKLIFVGVRFDESRMFDLLEYIRQDVEHKKIPIVAAAALCKTR